MSGTGAAIAPNGGQHPLLTFGVELELVLRPLPVAQEDFAHIYQRHPDGQYIKIFAEILAEIVQLESFSCLAEGTPEYEGAKNTGTLMNNWLVVIDGTVTSESEDWGLELISRVLKPQASDKWSKEIKMVWTAITDYFNVIPSNSASTHIHVKRHSASTGYAMPDLKAICKAIAYWEPAIRETIPPARRDSKYALSNIKLSRPPPSRMQWLAFKDYLTVANTGFGPMFANIDALAENEALIRYMQGTQKNYAWNFINLQQNGIGTIEFRRPPMSQGFADTLHWVTLATSFIASASEFNFANVSAEKVAKPLSSLEPSYLHLGLPQIVQGVELLRIQSFAVVQAQPQPASRVAPAPSATVAILGPVAQSMAVPIIHSLISGQQAGSSSTKKPPKTL